MQASSARGEDLAGRILSGAVNLLGALVALGAAFYLANSLLSDQQAMMVGVIGLALVLVVLAISPRAGLWLWIALGPVSVLIKLSMGSGIPDLGLHRVAALFLTGLLFAQVAIRQRRLLRPTAIEWAALAYGAALLASAPASRSGLLRATQGISDFVIIPLLVFVFARGLQAGRTDIRGAFAALALAGVTLGLATLREQLTGVTFLSPHPFSWVYVANIRKITSVFGHPAIMATTLTVVIPAIFYGFIRAKTLAGRLLWGGAFAISLLGLFMTYVRAGWLAVVVALVIMLLLSRQARRYFLPFVILAVILLALFGSNVASEGVITARLSSQAPITYRLEALKIGWQIFQRSPLIGIGFDNFSQAAIDAGFVPHLVTGGLPDVLPHNLYIYIMVSAGLLGLLPFVALLGLILWRAIRLWRQTDSPLPVNKDLLAALIGTVVGYMIIIGTYDAMGAQLGSLFFFFVAGTILGAHEPQPAEVTA
jgi:hypothetical protein